MQRKLAIGLFVLSLIFIFRIFSNINPSEADGTANSGRKSSQ